MKHFKNLLTVASFLALVIFIGCADDTMVEEPSAGEEQYDLLEGTWTISAVTFDGTSRIDTWGTNFTLTFSGGAENATTLVWGGNYSTSGHDTSGEPDALTVWPSSGNWNFEGENGVQLFTRSDDVDVTVTSVSGLDAATRTLVLTFTIPDPGARTEQVFDAPWVFTFTR